MIASAPVSGVRMPFAEAAWRSMQNAPEQDQYAVALDILHARRADRGLIALENGHKRSIPAAE